MSRGRALAALSVLTAEQWGMVTAAQARWLGVSRVDIGRLLADGALELVEGAARVYRLAGWPPDPAPGPPRRVGAPTPPRTPLSSRRCCSVRQETTGQSVRQETTGQSVRQETTERQTT